MLSAEDCTDNVQNIQQLSDLTHHRWQPHTIAALFSHRPNLFLGFAMFPQRVQPALNRWSNGDPPMRIIG
jgi:hypothetical protein